METSQARRILLAFASFNTQCRDSTLPVSRRQVVFLMPDLTPIMSEEVMENARKICEIVKGTKIGLPVSSK